MIAILYILIHPSKYFSKIKRAINSPTLPQSPLEVKDGHVYPVQVSGLHDRRRIGGTRFVFLFRVVRFSPLLYGEAQLGIPDKRESYH